MEITPQFYTLLELLVAKQGSSLYLTVNSCPAMRIYGKVIKFPELPVLQSNDIQAVADHIMNSEQAEHFKRNPELNVSLSIHNLGRFRVHFFRQRNALAVVINISKQKFLRLAN